MTPYLPALAGGLLIGLAATVFLIADGRVAGVSGVVDGLAGRDLGRVAVNAAFVAGLLLGPVLLRAASGAWPSARPSGSLVLMAGAGLLVGFGTRLGSGCTSGHGVVGLARLSPRSIAAVATFMAAAVATVYLMRRAGLS